MSGSHVSTVPIPDKLRGNALWRGLAVPWIALMRDDGTPDFRVIDSEKRSLTARFRLCQLCGNKLGRHLFFVGGPLAADARQFYEPPAHLECVLYAMQVCPFILGRIEHADIAKVEQDNPGVRVHQDSAYSVVRSPEWRIIHATDYEIIRAGAGEWLFRPLGIVRETGDLRPDAMSAADWATVEEGLRK